MRHNNETCRRSLHRKQVKWLLDLTDQDSLFSVTVIIQMMALSASAPHKAASSLSHNSTAIIKYAENISITELIKKERWSSMHLRMLFLKQLQF